MNKRIKFDYIQYFIRPVVSMMGNPSYKCMDEDTRIILGGLKEYAEEEKISCVPASYEIPKDSCILIIAIGGDGTMLGAMRASLEYSNAIVFGVNTGNLGFLSEDINLNIGEAINKIEMRSGLIEERMTISGDIIIDGEVVQKAVAINEFTMAGMTLQKPLTIDVDINKHNVSSMVGSGMVVATSTGSTALALSGGGAIVSPSTNVMQIVPIMPHTLTSRPIITTGRDVITISAPLTKNNVTVEIYGDGICLHSMAYDEGDRLTLRIRKHENKVKVYRPPNWNFFDVLSKKLKW